MKILLLLTCVGLVISWGRFGLSHRRGGSVSRTGEEVYVSEGCIHCHSQYSRPGTKDAEYYGAASEVPDGKGGAVLIGNRRQGPDLSSVGLRRSRDWNRAHLINPNKVSPGSRMPSYRHLFDGEGEDGEALLDYLNGLGGDSTSPWLVTVQSWDVESGLEANLSNGLALYRENCAQCHGVSGDGDGVNSQQFYPRPRNLRSGQKLFVPRSLAGEQRGRRLGQIMKFGIWGTSMPGHEYLTDQEIVDLVAYVLSIESSDLE